MIDKIDRKLLSLLQNDCTLSLQALADAVNLTTTPCWKRLKRLEDEGILRGRVALLDAEKVGLGLTAFFFTYHAPPVVWLAALGVMGFGIGAAMSAASTAVMTSAPEEKAGMAASVEEVSYELGGALGVAVLGSIMSAIYTAALVLPDGLAVTVTARDSLDEALLAAEQLTPEAARGLVDLARAAFDRAFEGVIVTASCLLFVSALAIALANRSRSPAGDIARQARH